MKTYIFDIDGTISKNGKPIDPDIHQSLESLSQDNKVIFASARPVRDILPLLPKQFHSATIVGCNGGMIWEDNRLKSIHYFEPEAMNIILSYLKANHVPYVLDGSWHYAFSSVDHPFHDYVRSLTDHEVSESSILDGGVIKILILDNRHYDPLHDLLDANSITYSSAYHKQDDFFDITPQDNNKYSSLLGYGIDFSSAVAFGNDANDFLMLDNAAVSVYIGSNPVYTDATYYCEMDEIPKILKKIL